MTDLSKLPVRLDRRDAVATLTLDRPQALNALDDAMIDGLARATAEVAADPAVRCLVVTGAGEHFMAGGDIKVFAEAIDTLDGADRRARFDRLIARVHDSILALTGMPKPVVASIRGACAGFGLSLALACDLAIAAEDAVFTLAYARIGATPDGGATYHLPRVVGRRKAMELALLADRFDAAEALRLGIVNRVVPVDRLAAETAALADRLAAGPADAYARAKALIGDSLDRSLGAQLVAEQKAFTDTALGDDFAEGVRAFVEKRPPRFGGR